MTDRAIARTLSFLIRDELLHLQGGLLQVVEQFRVVAGLAVSERRIQHHDGPAHVRCEDIAVVQFKALLAGGSLEPFHDRAEESQGIVRNAFHDEGGIGEHQHLLVPRQRRRDTGGLGQEVVHSRYIALRQEVRNVVIDKVGNTGQGVHVELGADFFAPAFGVVFQRGVDEAVDRLDRLVRVPGVGEQDQQLVGAGDILIDGHLFPLPRSERQEITDVLAEIQSGQQDGQDDGERDQADAPDTPVPGEEIKYVRYLHDSLSPHREI